VGTAWITGYPEPISAPNLIMTGGMEATGHEEEATLTKETHHDKVCLARPISSMLKPQF
jgi:hypothetical protein